MSIILIIIIKTLQHYSAEKYSPIGLTVDLAVSV